MKKLLTLFTILLTVFLANFQLMAQTSVGTFGTPILQDFNTLTPAGTWTNNSTLSGWYARTDATSNITTFGLNTGSTTTAALYSFGSTSASDRAFGFAASNGFTGAASTGKGYMGWRILNTTGQVVTSITINWDGEQWRKMDNANTHSIILTYQIGSTVTDITGGTWVSTGLSFDSPITGATGTLVLDGNATGNKEENITIMLTGLNLGIGQEIMFRWEDLNDSGNDHFLAIDNVSVTFNAPLPVTLLTFNTKTDKNNQILSWTYESPERFDYFQIEHSRDGKSFNSLDRVAEGEIASRAYKANYTHVRPGAGIHYYRLKMVDLDGSFAYSQVVQGRIDGNGSVRPLSTFISAEGLNVSVETSVSSLELRLVDQLGRTMYHSTQAAEAGIINIPVSNLTAGLYFLQVHADGVMETHKLVR